MGIFSRLTDIINSNLNALLDQAEDPEKMVRLMIQEMEDTLVEVRSTAARTIADKKGLNRKLDSLSAALEDWTAKAELALSKGREDLARGALLERKKLESAAASFRGELEYLDEALARNDNDVARLQSKLDEARAKQKTIRARHESVGVRIKVRRQLHDSRIEEAFARFEHMEQRLDTAEGELEAYDLGQRKTLADEIDELGAEGEIDRELSDLKARVGAKE
ncbi:MAG TPA: phage shock protein PspA [Alphaproteobacteria bacterium]|nr:phage shock protein PspA [Alphaproteobacteria bacterium]